MSTTALATKTDVGAQIESVLITGDLAKLSAEQRVNYYRAVCNSLGLNPLTEPFAYISLNGKLKLYAQKNCAEQLREIKGVSIDDVTDTVINEVYIVTAKASLPSGRKDAAKGAVPLKGLQGEALANAMMKAETKAKRRVTLSLCGLGMLDETEVDSIPGAKPQEPTELEQQLQASIAMQKAQKLMEVPAPAPKAATPVTSTTSQLSPSNNSQTTTQSGQITPTSGDSPSPKDQGATVDASFVTVPTTDTEAAQPPLSEEGDELEWREGDSRDLVECFRWDAKDKEWFSRGPLEKRRERQHRHFMALRTELGIADAEWRSKLVQYFNKETSKLLSVDEAQDLIAKLETRKKRFGTKAQKDAKQAARASEMVRDLAQHLVEEAP